MVFEYHRLEALPRLSWCAEMRAGRVSLARPRYWLGAAPGGWTDNGSEIASCLGMSARVYYYEDYLELSGLADAEFCASGTSGSGAPLALAEKQLGGAILSSGRPGGYTWVLDQRYNLPDLMAGCLYGSIERFHWMHCTP